MTQKYHISPDNQVRPCRAKILCKYTSWSGGKQSFESKIEAVMVASRRGGTESDLRQQNQKASSNILKTFPKESYFNEVIGTATASKKGFLNFKQANIDEQPKEIEELREIIFVGYSHINSFRRILNNYRSSQDYRKNLVKFLEMRGVEMATDEDISLMGIDNLEFIEAAKCFPSIWVRLSARTKKPKLTIDTFDPGKLNVLGMYNRETGVISYSNKLTSKKLKSHFTHELAHRMEAILPSELEDPSRLALEIRTTLSSGEREEARGTPRFSYRKDGFFDFYSGREYESDPNFQEHFAIGYESLFFNRNNFLFAGKEDSETVAMILGLLITKGGKR